LLCKDEKHEDAIKEFENILRICIISPTEKMSILLNLGNAYYSLSQNDKALENYNASLMMTEKVDKKDVLEGKASDLGNIGLIYSDKGDLDNALKYLRKALEVLERFNLIYGKEIIKNEINFIERKKQGIF